MKYLSEPTCVVAAGAQNDTKLAFATNLLPSLRQLWQTAALLFISPDTLLRNFQTENILGCGRYGKVLRMKSRRQVHGQDKLLCSLCLGAKSSKVAAASAPTRNREQRDILEVAVKYLQKPDKDTAKFLREIRIHAFVTSHQLSQVVPLMAVVVDRVLKQVATVMPVYTGGTLEDELEASRTTMSQKKRKLLLQRRWCEGDAILQLLHEKCHVVHGDAHPGNWYLERPGGRMLLGDFGEAHLAQECAAFGDFLLLASHERLAFRYELLADYAEKRLLGEKLGALDERIEKLPLLLCTNDCVERPEQLLIE